jgi:hypothetical protein
MKLGLSTVLELRGYPSVAVLSIFRDSSSSPGGMAMLDLLSLVYSYRGVYDVTTKHGIWNCGICGLLWTLWTFVDFCGRCGLLWTFLD